MAGGPDLVVRDHSEGCLGDVGRCSRLAQAVFADVRSADCQAGDAHRFGRTHVLVGKGASDASRVQGHIIPADKSHQAGAAQVACGGGVAIINFVVGANAGYGQPLGGDVGGRTGGGVEGVVASVGAANGDAAYAHALGSPHVLVGKAGAGVAAAQAIARHPVVRKNHAGVGAAVIDLVDARGRHNEGARGDVGGRAGRGVRGVIGGIGAAEANAVDAHALDHSNVLVGKAGAGVAGAQDVTRQSII